MDNPKNPLNDNNKYAINYIIKMYLINKIFNTLLYIVLIVGLVELGKIFEFILILKFIIPN